MKELSIPTRISLATALLAILSSACAAPEPVIIVHTQEVTRQVEATRIVAVPVTVTPSPTPAHSPTATRTATITPTASLTPTTAPVIAVVLEQANCRYGAGAAYLYKYGLFPGENYVVVGRNRAGDWVYLEPRYGGNRCWASVKVLEIRGDVYSVGEVHTLLPYTEFYYAPRGVHAKREGDQVIVSWEEIPMSLDDDRGYLIEAWVCQGGQYIFIALQTYQNIINIIDESGCDEPSSGRLYGAEKHGYTSWVAIPWPDPEPTPSP